MVATFPQFCFGKRTFSTSNAKIAMTEFYSDRQYSDAWYHIRFDTSLGYQEALNWLDIEPNSPWAAMFYQPHQPEILHFFESGEHAFLVNQSWVINQLYLLFRSIRDAAMFKLRFNATALGQGAFARL